MEACRCAVVVSLVACVAVIMGGCAQKNDAPAARPSVTPTAVSEPLSKGTLAPGDWTLTVPEGVLKCYSEDSMVTFTADGVEYGLSQTAIRFGGYPDIHQILPPLKTGVVEVNGQRQAAPITSPIPDGLLSRAQSLCHGIG
jgi:hypothetical protein